MLFLYEKNEDKVNLRKYLGIISYTTNTLIYKLQKTDRP